MSKKEENPFYTLDPLESIQIQSLNENRDSVGYSLALLAADAEGFAHGKIKINQASINNVEQNSVEQYGYWWYRPNSGKYQKIFKSIAGFCNKALAKVNGSTSGESAIHYLGLYSKEGEEEVEIDNKHGLSVGGYRYNRLGIFAGTTEKFSSNTGTITGWGSHMYILNKREENKEQHMMYIGNIYRPNHHSIVLGYFTGYNLFDSLNQSQLYQDFQSGSVFSEFITHSLVTGDAQKQRISIDLSSDIPRNPSAPSKFLSNPKKHDSLTAAIKFIEERTKAL